MISFSPTIIHIPAAAATTTTRKIPASKPPQHQRRRRRRRYLVFFVTGNPGLVGYYELFLSHLHHLLSSSSAGLSDGSSFEVFGRSLSGFEVDGAGAGAGGSYPASGTAPDGAPPFGLQEQICGAEWTLWDHVKGMREEEEEEEEEEERGGGGREWVAVDGEGRGWDDEGEEEEPRVILIGHSVGAYIALEICRRWQERLKRRAEAGKPDGVNGATRRAGEEKGDDGRLVGSICLFPTVTHIAKSSSGRKFSILFSFPSFALLASIFAALLTSWLPASLLARLVRLAARMPPAAAGTTTAFIRSRHGVRQALHLARDEMRSIAADAWDAELWGAAAPTALPCPRPRLFFLFGTDDHWVADETRDELIEMRGRRGAAMGERPEEDWKPVMEIDEQGIPHGFCIDPRHSIMVAEKVARYIEQIVKHDNS